MIAGYPVTSAVILSLMVILAVGWDLREHRIPNLITLGGAALALVVHVLTGGLDGLWAGLGGWAVGLAFFLPGYLFGFTGAGDAKLMAAVGACLGPQTAIYAAAASVVAGGLMALIWIAYLALSRVGTAPWERYRGMLQFLWVTGRPSYVPPAAGEVAGRRFPYALAIAAGTLGVLASEMKLF